MSAFIDPKQFEQSYKRKLGRMRTLTYKIKDSIDQKMSIEEVSQLELQQSLIISSIEPMMVEIADILRLSHEKIPPVFIHLTCQDDCDRFLSVAKTLRWTWKNEQPIKEDSIYFIYEQDTCIVINTNTNPCLPPYLTFNSYEMYKATTFEIHDFEWFKVLIKDIIDKSKQKVKPLKVVIDDDL